MNSNSSRMRYLTSVIAGKALSSSVQPPQLTSARNAPLFFGDSGTDSTIWRWSSVPTNMARREQVGGHLAAHALSIILQQTAGSVSKLARAAVRERADACFRDDRRAQHAGTRCASADSITAASSAHEMVRI